MFNKIYLSRKETKSWGMENPVGDPFGGPAYGEFNDPVSAAIVGGGALLGGALSASAAKSAAGQQAAAMGRAGQIQQQQYEQTRADLAPYREQGYTALSDIAAMKPYLTAQFGSQQLQQYLDPSMAFRMGLGQQATQRAANVAGGGLSGNTLRALQDYSQGLASTEYANAFNRFQTERGNIYNTLANIAGMGQNAVNTGVNAGQAYAQNLGQLAVGQGQAQAAGTVGQAQALGGAAQNISNMYALSSLLKRNQPSSVVPTISGGILPGVNQYGSFDMGPIGSGASFYEGL